MQRNWTHLNTTEYTNEGSSLTMSSLSSPSSLSSRRFVALFGASLAALVSLSGCSALGSLTDLAEGKSDVFSLAVGDCFNDEDTETISSVKVLECAEAHDNEVYFEYALADDAFGSGSYDEEFVFADAEQKCLPTFEEFVGSTYENTGLNFSYLYPTEQSWSEDDRSIQCVAYWDNGPISGSLSGKGADYLLE